MMKRNEMNGYPMLRDIAAQRAVYDAGPYIESVGSDGVGSGGGDEGRSSSMLAALTCSLPGIEGVGRGRAAGTADASKDDEITLYLNLSTNAFAVLVDWEGDRCECTIYSEFKV